MLTAPLGGVTRCACGSKYWDGTVCASCGERWSPWRSCAACGDPDPEYHDPTVADGAALCDECYLDLRG